jgi:predicted small metal-binding protein
MGKAFKCSDIARCRWKSSAETEEELLEKVIQHAADEHEIKNMTDTMLKRIKNLMEDK